MGAMGICDEAEHRRATRSCSTRLRANPFGVARFDSGRGLAVMTRDTELRREIARVAPYANNHNAEAEAQHD
jgi:hypothetical protein